MEHTNEYIKERAKELDPKTSSSNGESSEDKTSGESTVQEGQQVVNEEDQNKTVNTEETNEEYISDINSNTEQANTNPKGLINLASMPDGDDDDDDDDDDDPSTDIEIGDDPDETKKKIPVM